MRDTGNLYALFEERFPDDEDAAAFETLDGATVSYPELARQVARFANALARCSLEVRSTAP